MAQRSGARAGAARYIHSHGGVPQARLGDLRHLGGLGRTQPSGSIGRKIRSVVLSKAFFRIAVSNWSLATKSCPKVQVTNCQATLDLVRESNRNRGDKSHKMQEIPRLTGSLSRGRIQSS